MSKDKALDIVLSEFLELAKVPRPSHHEERVSEYLFQWAKRHGLAVEKDNMNEIIIDKPATPRLRECTPCDLSGTHGYGLRMRRGRHLRSYERPYQGHQR